MGGRVVLKVDVELEVPLAAFLVGRAEFQFQASQRTVLVSTCKSAVTCGGGGVVVVVLGVQSRAYECMNEM